jgi:hypothetical protein
MTSTPGSAGTAASSGRGTPRWRAPQGLPVTTLQVTSQSRPGGAPRISTQSNRPAAQRAHRSAVTQPSPRPHSTPARSSRQTCPDAPSPAAATHSGAIRSATSARSRRLPAAVPLTTTAARRLRPTSHCPVQPNLRSLFQRVMLRTSTALLIALLTLISRSGETTAISCCRASGPIRRQLRVAPAC